MRYKANQNIYRMSTQDYIKESNAQFDLDLYAAIAQTNERVSIIKHKAPLPSSTTPWWYNRLIDIPVRILPSKPAKNAWEHATSWDDLRPSMYETMHYSNGCIEATTGFIAISVLREYAPEYEGTVRHIHTNTQQEHTFPNFQSIIPDNFPHPKTIGGKYAYEKKGSAGWELHATYDVALLADIVRSLVRFWGTLFRSQKRGKRVAQIPISFANVTCNGTYLMHLLDVLETEGVTTVGCYARNTKAESNMLVFMAPQALGLIMSILWDRDAYLTYSVDEYYNQQDKQFGGLF